MPGGPNNLGGGQSFVQAGNNNGGGFNRLAFFGIGAMQMRMGHMMRKDIIQAQGEEHRKTISHKTDEGIKADIAKGFISRQHLTEDYDTIFAKDEKGEYTRPEMADHFKLGGFERNAHGIQPGAISGIKIADINSKNRDLDLQSKKDAAEKGADPTKEELSKAVSANTTKVDAISVDSSGEASKTKVRKPNEVSPLGSLKNKDTGEWEPIKDESGNLAQGPLFTQENADDLYESRGESFNKSRGNQDGNNN